MARGKARRSIDIIEAAHDILSEIQPASVRAVCYRLFTQGLIPDMSKGSTNSVSRLLTRAREDNTIPWEWIVDESREAETVYAWDSADQAIRSTVKHYRRDYWQDQPRHIEVWSEKGTVRGTVAPVLDELGVTFRVMHGYSSATVVNTIAEESRRGAINGKDFHALYVGDFDPSGLHMSEEDLPRRLSEYAGFVDLRRVALLKSDTRGLPGFSPETKTTDPRYPWFKARHPRSQCYELDAMNPNALRERVRKEIEALIDRPLWDRAVEVERVEVASMRDFHEQWKARLG
jgi:hypothetical protein